MSCLYFTETGFYYSTFFHHWEGVENIKYMINYKYVNVDILQISHWYLPHVYECGIFSHISSQLQILVLEHNIFINGYFLYTTCHHKLKESSREDF